MVIFGYENGGFLAPVYPCFFDVEQFPNVRMVGITAQEQQRNLDALNRLIRMALDRGVRVTLGLWDHIYRGGVHGGGIPGADRATKEPTPGLVCGVTEKNLVPYAQAALAKFVRVVPELDAIQFRMHDESGLKNNEQVRSSRTVPSDGPRRAHESAYDFMYFIEVMDTSGNGGIFRDLNKEAPYIVVRIER